MLRDPWHYGSQLRRYGLRSSQLADGLFLVGLVEEINIFPVKVQGDWIPQEVLQGPLRKTSTPCCSNSTYSLTDEEDSCCVRAALLNYPFHHVLEARDSSLE